MRKVSLKIAAAALILIVVCVVCRFVRGNTVVNIMQNPGFADQAWSEPPANLLVEYEEDGVVEIESVRIHGNVMEVRMQALAPGETGAEYRMQGDSDGFRYSFYKVDRSLTITCDGMIFTGLDVSILAVGLFLLAVCIFFLQYFLRLRGSEIYSYLAIFSIGMALFAGAGAFSVLWSALKSRLNPLSYGLGAALNNVSRTAGSCILYLTIPMLVFAVSMIISNVELLRHERPRFANLLGILIPVAMILGEVISIGAGLLSFQGSFEEYRIREIIINIYNTVYVYFECMLAGSVICGIRAVKHRVSPDRDYILILGCKFRDDGTLTPLLKGRCDAAIHLWRRQKQESGKEAVMIPSGGQGADETMPEAEAMARYLLQEGIPETCIIREDQSKNTYQNMEFSKRIIDERTKDAKVAYATTNYHVFRSGLWANLAGLPAEGVGGVTKWWFWPNAFMRECIGLMANRVRQEIVLLVLTIIVSIVLSFFAIR